MNDKSTNIKATGILLVLILMLMAGLIYINNMNSVDGFAAKSVRSLGILGQVEAEEKNSSVCELDNLLTESMGAVVKARGINGDTMWSKTLIGKVTAMKSAAAKLYVLDSGKKLYCISKEGMLLWERQLEGDIKRIYTEKSGDVLISYKSDNGTKVQILSGKGVDEGSMVLENADVVAFASGEKENTLSVLDISTQMLKTKLITLSLRGDMTWSDNFDNQIIPAIGYGRDNTLIAIGEKEIFKYKNQSKKQSKLDLDKTIYNASISDGGIAAVVRNRKGYEVLTYDLNFKQQGCLEIEKAPEGIILGKNNYILYYNEKLMLADTKGMVKAEFNSIPEINRAYFAEDGSIILASNRIIQQLSQK